MSLFKERFNLLHLRVASMKCCFGPSSSRPTVPPEPLLDEELNELQLQPFVNVLIEKLYLFV